MRKTKFSSPSARKESKKEYRSRQARLDVLYPNRHVVCTLQDWNCYAVAAYGEPILLRRCAAYTALGATDVATSTLANLTRIQLFTKGLRRKSRVWVEPV
jgi:hypothetical protein